MRPNNLLTSTALTTSAVLASGAALAQPVTYNWTGWYVGVNLGAGFSDIDHGFAIPGTPPRSVAFSGGGTDTTFTGGFQAGYNWFVVPGWVFGVEGDWNYLGGQRDDNFRAVLVAPAGASGSEDVVGRQTSRVRWLSTIRARFGYVWNSSLFYATGGLAIGGVTSSATAQITSRNGDSTSYAGSVTSTRTGWTVGGGLEHAFNNRVSVKLEYLHFDLGSVDYGVPGVITSGTGNGFSLNGTAHADFSGDLVRFGLNVKLGP